MVRDPAATLISSEPELFPSFSEDDVRGAVEILERGAGEPSGLASGAFEIFVSALRHDPTAPAWPGRDRCVAVGAEAARLVSTLQQLFGYERADAPAADLGAAIAVAGTAKELAARYGERFGSRTFVLASDGALPADAVASAGQRGLGGLIVLQGVAGADPALAESNGWFVQRVDAEDHVQIRAALSQALQQDARPSLLVAQRRAGHARGAGAAPQERVQALFTARARVLGALRAGWEREYAAFAEESPELAAEVTALLARG